MFKPRDVPDVPRGSREATDKSQRPYLLPQTSYQLMDPALKKILVGVLGDDGSIEDSLATALLKSILDSVSLSLVDIDVLQLPAAKKYLLKAFKVYVWWYDFQTGRPPLCFDDQREVCLLQKQPLLVPRD